MEGFTNHLVDDNIARPAPNGNTPREHDGSRVSEVLEIELRLLVINLSIAAGSRDFGAKTAIAESFALRNAKFVRKKDHF
jgi:hypothetical protein